MRGLSLVLLALVGLASCGQPDRRTSVLWTNSPEIAIAVERFNADQTSWQILVEYRTDLAEALATPGAAPDLVVGRSINQGSVLGSLSSLDFLFDRGEVSRASFYRDLIERGSLGSELRLVPLAFDVPVLVYSSQRLPELDALSLTPSGVRALSATFQIGVKGSGLRLGFSPLWASFPLDYLHAVGAAFSGDSQGTLLWNQGALEGGLKQLSEWTAAEGQGWKTQKDFTAKYLSTSPWPLLKEGRLLFYPSRLSEFVALPLDERRGLDFRYLDVAGKIGASEDVLWAGIPATSTSPGAAREFLADLVGPARQKSLSTWSRQNEFRPFGLLGGLSALVATNQTVLPELYPDLESRVPGPTQLSFWLAMPTNWAVLRDRVVLPWLQTGPAPDKLSALQELLFNFGKPTSNASANR